jgi:hypothetical protein
MLHDHATPDKFLRDSPPHPTLLLARSIPCVSHLQVMAEKFLRVAGQYNWAGVSCFVSTLMITIATFMLRFLSLPPSDAYV